MPTSSPIRVAVITGVHPYHVPDFQSAFRGFADMDCYPQSLEPILGGERIVGQDHVKTLRRQSGFKTRTVVRQHALNLVPFLG